MQLQKQSSIKKNCLKMIINKAKIQMQQSIAAYVGLGENLKLDTV